MNYGDISVKAAGSREAYAAGIAACNYSYSNAFSAEIIGNGSSGKVSAETGNQGFAFAGGIVAAAFPPESLDFFTGGIIEDNFSAAVLGGAGGLVALGGIAGCADGYRSFLSFTFYAADTRYHDTIAGNYYVKHQTVAFGIASGCYVANDRRYVDPNFGRDYGCTPMNIKDFEEKYSGFLL